MSAVENKALIEEFVNLLNRGDLQTAGEYCSPDYLYHGPGGLELEGTEGFKLVAAGYYSAFPDFHMTIEDIFGEGDRVVSRYEGSGTHKGEIMGIPATGKKVSFKGTIISRIENGKFVEDWDSFDTLGLMRQLSGSLGN